MKLTRGSTVIEFTHEETSLLRRLAGSTGGPDIKGTLTMRCASEEEAVRIRQCLLDKLYDALTADER